MGDARPDSLLAVKAKSGELDAVLNTRLDGGAVDVMVELLDAVQVGSDVAKKITEAGVRAARVGRPLWLDVTWLHESSPLCRLQRGALEHFEDRIEQQLFSDLFADDGMPPLIPVVSASAGDHELRRIRALLEHEHRCIAVRSRNASRRGARHLADQIERVVRFLQISARDVHLIVDEGFVDEFDQRRVAELATNLQQVLDEHGGLASVISLSGSAPKRRVDYETRVLGRPEVQLWRSLDEVCRRGIRYGDYGVVHPEPPRAGKGGGQPNPYIHYTVPAGRLSLARHVPERRGPALPAGAAEHYFLDIADELVHRPEFAGPDFSWGDLRLDECTGPRKPAVGKSDRWISMATSHHLAHLSRNLDAA